jgi:hypothetical protein
MKRNCLIAFAATLPLGVTIVGFQDSANAQASSDTSGVVAGQAKSDEPSSGAGSVQLPSPNSEDQQGHCPARHDAKVTSSESLVVQQIVLFLLFVGMLLAPVEGRSES